METPEERMGKYDLNLLSDTGTTEHSVSGGWLGSYYYDKRSGNQPARFEATFSRNGREGSFDGSILDDAVLGEARVLEGLQSGRSVSFTKVYINPPQGHSVHPITYEGTLSEDGKRISGKWQLDYRGARQRKSVRMTGSWEAHRLWNDLLEEEAVPEHEGLLLESGRR
jgi:hypothetical protein